MGTHAPFTNRKENRTSPALPKNQPNQVPNTRTHLLNKRKGQNNDNKSKTYCETTTQLPDLNRHRPSNTTNNDTTQSQIQHVEIKHLIWIDRIHGKPCAQIISHLSGIQLIHGPELMHDQTIEATSKKPVSYRQPKRPNPWSLKDHNGGSAQGQGRNPPANENRPQPQVETATARRHSSHHNDSQTVFWFCQNWQQHQMISPRKMKLPVNQGNQLFTRCSFFTCKESPLALSLGSIELIQYEFSDEVKTSVHCVPEENCQTYRLGEVMWPSAKCLGDFALRNADVFTDKSLVELDSGTGLCGLNAAHNCSRVVLTDNVKDVVTLLRKNVNSNFRNSAHIQTAKLAWGKGIDEFTKEHGLFDIVAGTDAVYDSALICPLFVTAARVLQENGALFLLNHHHTKDVRLHLRRALCQKEVLEPRRDLAERSLNPDGTWHEGGHHHTKDVLLHLRRALCQKYVLHETLQALNLTVVNSINHNFSKNNFLRI